MFTWRLKIILLLTQSLYIQAGYIGGDFEVTAHSADFSSSDVGEKYAGDSENHEYYEKSEPSLGLELEEHHGEEPVQGIDHGKDAFSYSTLYEFKDRQEHEQYQLEHQLKEQQVEQQLELEHQNHHLESQLELH